MRAQDKWRSAFEEGVRWVAPIQASSRLVMEDTEIRGCLIPKGDTVMTIQASANRDEELFTDGETYNALRDPTPHRPSATAPTTAPAPTSPAAPSAPSCCCCLRGFRGWSWSMRRACDGTGSGFGGRWVWR